ncbi:MAG: Na+/H+ antiporter subunit E [Kiloniellales bacterium]|nr:Na+/H+ antiporter subunit E [Kiloniellales bacterium]
MSIFVLNVFLALSWAALVGSFTLPSLLLGYGVGYLALWVARPMFGRSTYFERVWRILRLAALFVYELFVSSLRVVWDVLTPTHLSRPGIVAMPLDAEGESEILLVANLISLTPGSLSIDLSPDQKTLYVHAMFVEDPEALRRELKSGVERRVREALE